MEIKMGKRFTATEKWGDPWFRKMPPEMKAFWVFLTDNCDAAGVWNVDYDLATFMVGAEITEEMVSKWLEDRVQFLKEGRYLHVKKFVDFQYGEIKEGYNPHVPVIKSLKRHGLFSTLDEPLLKGSRTLMDKDKDKDKEKDKDVKQQNGQNEKRDPTPVQRVVKAWKILNDIPVQGEESRTWDKVHFARHSRSAKSLIDLFGGWEPAVDAMEYLYMHFKTKHLTATIETIVKHSDLYREYLAGRQL